ncbi:MAG: type II toxin-antitoxin system PemK/MazF family toxin [Microbacterium sp.]|uniref:type II toxin-antitoxin system PemK/MazF family toxin n=1 Tax=Microbacterium sp. TaxID=51671 RepID=UPI0039E70192
MKTAISMPDDDFHRFERVAARHGMNRSEFFRAAAPQFGALRGSEPAKTRPTAVLQDDWLSATNIRTVLLAPLTSNVALEAFPGNVLIPAEASGLDKDCVVVVSQLGPVSRELIEPHPAGHVPGYLVNDIVAGVRLTLGI